MSNTNKLDRVVQLLNQRGFAGLVIYASGQRMGPKYLYYFSGVKPLGLNNAAIISKAGDVALLVQPQWDSIRASENSWIKDIIGSSNFLKDLADIMRKFKITGSVGVVGSEEMTEDVYRTIKNEANIESADDLIEGIASERTKEEIELARRAGRIGDIGFKAALEHTRVGIREYELQAEIEFAMHCAGADDNFGLLSSGKHNQSMHFATDKRLSEGDIVIFEITPLVDGQSIQLCRTVSLGEPSRLLLEKYDMLIHALEESFKQIKPGAPAALIAQAQNKIISGAGYGEYCRPPYMRTRGHGTGIASNAPGPMLEEDIKTNIESGQVMIVHPNQYIPETGYLACGETILVTDTGIDRLSETECKVYIKEV